MAHRRPRTDNGASWDNDPIAQSAPSSRNLRPRDTLNITALDLHIAQHGGTTTSIERLPHRLQQSKRQNILNPNQRIEELVKETGRLREEIAFHVETQRALMALFETAKEAFETLREGLQVTSERLFNTERSLLEYWGIERGQSSGRSI
jgi:hypothetical protein